MKRLLLILLLCCSAMNGFAGLTDPAAAPDIFTDGRDWFNWARGRVYEFYIACPRERATTYYFDQDGGNNANDGLTPATAKQTRAAAIALSAAESNVAFLFQRGDVWYESGNWPVGDNETIADYGDSSLANPRFDRFTVRHLATADAWGSPSGNRKQVNEATDVAWVKLAAFPLTRPLQRVATAADCASTSNSWAWVSNVLYINLAGDDPNDFDIDVCPSNDGESGVELTGDGSRVENIDGYGWGCHRTTTATQDQPITFRGRDDETSLAIKCGAYYSGSHALAHNMPTGGATGGRTCAVGCRAGYVKFNGVSGETVFNSYSEGGGQESWWVDCIADYGTLPSSDWAPATTFVRGQGFYAHTGAGNPSVDLIMHWGCVQENNTYGCQKLSHCPDATITTVRDDVKLYVVECLVEKPAQATGTTVVDFSPNSVYYSNRFYLFPNTASPNANEVTQRQNVWLANNYWNIDLDANNGSNYGIWNPSGAEDWKLYFDHDTFDILNAGATTGTARFGMDFDCRGISSASGAGVPGAGTSRNSTARNCVFSVNKDPGALNVYFLGLTNSSNVKNCALFGLTDSAGVERGYNLTTSPIALSAAHVWGTASNQLENAGDTTLRLELDINRRLRTSGTPTVGALETNPDPLPLARRTILLEDF